MPVLSQTGMVNLALREIGEFRIADINEDSPPAEVARDMYDHVRRKCLQAHDWRFASKQVELAEISTPPIVRFDKAWQLPSDFVRLSSVSDNTRMEPELREFSILGRTILTSTEFVFIEYVFDHILHTEWPDYFAGYMAAVLASEMAPAVKSASERERLEKLAMMRLPQARSIDSQQQPTIIVSEGNWIRAMRGPITWR